MQKHTRDLGSAPLVRLLIKLSVPSMLSIMTVTLYNTVDTFWVAKLGHEAIAGLTIVMPFQMLFNSIGLGTGIGVTALVSRRFGENNPEATNRVAGQILFLSLIWGALFMAAAFGFSDSILTLFGATPDIMDVSREYLLYVSLGSTQIIFILISGNLIRGSGDAVKPMVVMIGASVLNMILDPFLILGIGPFPELGIRGAAFATVFAQSIGALLAMYYLYARRTSYRIKASYLIPNFSILKDIYRVGGPAMLLEVTQSVSFVIFNKMLSVHGSIAIAGVGMPLRISDLVFVPLMGVSNGLLPIIGYNFGANNFRRLWDAVKKATIGMVVLLAVFTVAVEIFAPQIMSLFSDDPQILDMAIPAMRILLAGTVFIGPTLLFVTVFQGLSRGKMALIMSLLRQFLIFIPLLFALAHFFGVYGIMWSLPGSDYLSFISTCWFTWREYNLHKKAGKFDLTPDIVASRDTSAR